MTTTVAPVSPETPAVAAVSPKATSRFDFAEIVALAMTVVIGAGAFAWSFAALSDLSRMAGITDSLTWIGPVFVDGAIIQSIVALVSLKRRERFGVKIPKATRWFFWGELFAAELISVAGNALHAAESTGRVLPATIAACVAGAAPMFGLAATHGLTGLLEVPRAASPEATPGDSSVVEGDTTPGSGDSEATPESAEATPTVEEATAARDAEIWRLHREGLSYREIGPLVGVHSGSIGKILARLKAEHDATTIEPLALPEAPENVRYIAG
ncbi:DUF2637 domain-containing protein [Nocardia sp. NPDC001965]